jgi:hypothetical protein
MLGVIRSAEFLKYLRENSSTVFLKPGTSPEKYAHELYVAQFQKNKALLRRIYTSKNSVIATCEVYALTAALVLALTYHAFLSPTFYNDHGDVDERDDSLNIKLYGYACGFSLALCSLLLVEAITFAISLHLLNKPKDIAELIIHFGYFRAIMIVTFFLSYLTMFCGFLCGTLIIYGKQSFLVMGAITVAGSSGLNFLVMSFVRFTTERLDAQDKELRQRVDQELISALEEDVTGSSGGKTRESTTLQASRPDLAPPSTSTSGEGDRGFSVAEDSL